MEDKAVTDEHTDPTLEPGVEESAAVDEAALSSSGAEPSAAAEPSSEAGVDDAVSSDAGEVVSDEDLNELGFSADEIVTDEDLEDDLDEATEEKLDTSTVHEDKASAEPESEAAQASDEFLDTAMKEILERGGKLPTLDSADLLGRTYITDPDDEGEQHRAKIVDVGVLEERTPDGMQPLF